MNDRLSKIDLLSQPSKTKWKVVRPSLGWKDIINISLKENGNFLGGCKEGMFE